MNQSFRLFFEKIFGDEEAVSISILILLAVLALVFLGGYLAPLLAAIVISFVLGGVVNFLASFGLSKTLSVVLVYSGFMGLSAALFIFLLPELWHQLITIIENAPAIAEKIKAVVLSLQHDYPAIFSAAKVSELLAKFSGDLGNLTQSALAISFEGLQGVAQALIYLVLVPILVFFLMRDGTQLGSGFAQLLPKKREKLEYIWSEFIMQCGNYARGKVTEIIIVGVVSFIAFTLLGLEYAALLGLLVGLSVIIPFLGAAVVTIPVMAIGLYQWGFGGELFWLFIVYSVIQFLDGNVLVPLLFSEAVSIHPVSIIAAVLLFGGLWGIWGVFFAIPLATLIKALINSWPSRA